MDHCRNLLTIPTIAVLLAAAAGLAGAERRVDPTFLHRFVPDIPPKPADVTSSTCRYKPIFGAGDSDPSILRGVARFGEIEVDAGGSCTPVSYPAEEQIYFIEEGSGTLNYGGEKHFVRKEDFMYLPAGVSHAVATTETKCRFLVMGFKLPSSADRTVPPKLLIANLSEVKLQTVGGHPPSTLYQLMVGDRTSSRDRIAAGGVVTSLFVMVFAPGGTNAPHHHDSEEEIYLVLDGQGEIVAGGGMDGVEGRHPAKAGDAYFFRLNCTVGFYNRNEPGARARILAVRSLYPHRK